MNWADLWWRLSLIAKVAGREHRAMNPWRISLTTIWPRAMMQCLFFTMLSRLVNGDAGPAFAISGAVAITITLFTFAEVGDVPMRDRWAATFYRFRLGPLPVPLIYAVRSWPLLAEASVMSAACLLLIGATIGPERVTPQLTLLLPIYLVLVVTSAGAGLAVASLALFGRNGSDVITGNVLVYFIVASSGAIIPPGRVAWLDAIATVLPMRHGLQAIRNQLSGQPWMAELGMELLVGAGWAIAMVVAYAVLTERVRRTDHDKFA